MVFATLFAFATMGVMFGGVLVCFETLRILEELQDELLHPIGASELLNMLVIPEYIGVALCIPFLFCTREFWGVLVLLPLCFYHAHRYLNRPLKSRHGIYDPTTILNHGQLRYVEHECYIKTGAYVILMAYFFYRAGSLWLFGA